MTQWSELLNGIFGNDELNGKPLKKGALAPLVYFYNVLAGIKGKGFEQPGEIDHIIPQTAWESSTIAKKEAISNNAFNLALLPKDINASKNNKPLISLKTNTPIASEIVTYEEINLDDFEKYSSVSAYAELKRTREEKYKKAFGEKRDQILNNA